MSRIHGVRQIVEQSITGESIANTSIGDSKLLEISSAEKVNVTALKGVVPAANGGTGVNNGSYTITLGGNIQTSAPLSITGSQPIIFAGSTGATGPITFTLPENNSTLATTDQLAAMQAGLDLKGSCRFAIEAAFAATANGLILTADANGALTVDYLCDDVAPEVGQRVLVWKQGSAVQNGIYTITSLGSAESPFVLTRANDADGSPENEVTGGMYTFIEKGTLYGGHGFVLLADAASVIGVGTDPQVFSQFSGIGAIDFTANKFVLTGNQVDLAVEVATAFPTMTASNTELSQLHSAGATYDDFVKLHAVTASATELNQLTAAGATYDDFVKLHAVTASATELNQLTAAGATYDDFVKLHAVVATADEINALNLAGCTGGDFVKLHDLTVSEIDIGNIVTTTGAFTQNLDSGATGAAGADMVGVSEIANLTNAEGTVQGALEALQGEIDGLGSSLDALGSTGATSGADMVGVSAIANLVNAEGTVQGALEGLQLELDALGSTGATSGASLVAIAPIDGLSPASLDVQAALVALQGEISDLNSATGAIVDYEDIVVDGTTGVFMVGSTAGYQAGTLRVWDNGLLLKRGESEDYVESVTPTDRTFSLTYVPVSGTEIIVSYR